MLMREEDLDQRVFSECCCFDASQDGYIGLDSWANRHGELLSDGKESSGPDGGCGNRDEDSVNLSFLERPEERAEGEIWFRGSLPDVGASFTTRST